MAYKGKYKPKNRSKYKGDPTKIIYRSLWERRFMVYCDENPSIIKWASEEVVIPYNDHYFAYENKKLILKNKLVN